MKKIIFLLTLLILFTGCEIKDLSESEINSVIEKTLDYKVQNANNYFNGYKYYLPRGFNLESKKGNNHELSSNGDTYYLYVDVISYFHKEKIETTFDDEKLYFSKKISYNGIDGYIKIIDADDDMYYVEIVYNYSKIETYVKEENLEYAIKNTIRILSSVSYNDVILDTLIGDKTLDYQEEVYDEFGSKRKEGNFLDFIEEYGTYDEEDNKIKDDDILDSINE